MEGRGETDAVLDGVVLRRCPRADVARIDHLRAGSGDDAEAGDGAGVVVDLGDVNRLRSYSRYL